MSVLDILVYPEPALKRKSLPVENINKGLDCLLDDMAQTMRDANGVGLAAPQVGRNIQVLVVDVPLAEKQEGSQFYEFVNPIIVSSQGFQVGEEGCLSVPGFFAEIRRKEYISVSAFDREGRRFTIEADGMLSRVLQHEIDHLNGILFFERLTRLKRDIFVKQIDQCFAGGRS